MAGEGTNSRLTSIQIRLQNNQFTDEIPISVLASNIIYDPGGGNVSGGVNYGYNLTEILGNVNMNTLNNGGSLQEQINNLKSNILNVPSVVENWLENHYHASGDNITTNIYLDTEGAVADAKAAGSIVKVSDSQPTEPANKIWIKPSVNSVSVPTMQDIENIIAPQYSNSSPYNIGDYVIHDDLLYRCTTLIGSAGETWTSGHWTQVNVGNQLKTIPTVDPTLAVSGKAADAAKTGEELSNLKSDLSDIIESITPEWEQGGLKIQGEIARNALIRTGFIDVYAVGQLLLSASTSYAYAYYFYDSSQSYVSRNTNGAGSMTVDVPTGTRYVRFVFSYSGATQDITPNYGAYFKITLKKKTEYDVYPTFDLTDRAGDINAVLTKKSICRIAPGDYYIDVLVPYAGSEIIGCGNNTRLIRKSDSTYNYMIRLKPDSSLKNLVLVGSTTDIAVTSDWDYNGSPSGVCAIRIEGTGSDDTQRFRISIKDIKITSFAGSGIFVSKTGYHPEGCCYFENIFIRNCNAGISFGSYAEFHRITGLRANECYYGCVNNGGNNVFTNCDFSANIQGLLMDNSSGNFNNSSHGAFVGCTFNHSDSNNGVAIELNTMVAGEMFSGCSIFYGAIILTASQGIVFNACNFGSATPITITNGGGVQFANCMFRLGQSAVTDNRPSKTHFDNCYYLNGTIVDSVPQ